MTHRVHQVFAAVQHTAYFRKIKQAAVTLEGMHQPEQLRHQLSVMGSGFKLHQHGTNAFKRITRFRQKLFQQLVHAISPSNKATASCSCWGCMGLTM